MFESFSIWNLFFLYHWHAAGSLWDGVPILAFAIVLALASTIVHELGHAVAARSCGRHATILLLPWRFKSFRDDYGLLAWFCGGAATFDETGLRSWQIRLIAFCGPLAEGLFVFLTALFVLPLLERTVLPHIFLSSLYLWALIFGALFWRNLLPFRKFDGRVVLFG